MKINTSEKVKILACGAALLLGFAVVGGSLLSDRNELLSSAANLPSYHVTVSDSIDITAGEAAVGEIIESVSETVIEITAAQTEEPITEVPEITEAPVTEPPMTSVPETIPSETILPTTEAPATEPQVTAIPETAPPETLPPTTTASVTEPQMTTSAETEAPATEPPTTTAEETEIADTAPISEYRYVLNTNTKKFHHPACSSVKQMKEKNTATSNESRDVIIAMGYSPCGRCKP